MGLVDQMEQESLPGGSEVEMTLVANVNNSNATKRAKAKSRSLGKVRSTRAKPSNPTVRKGGKKQAETAYE